MTPEYLVQASGLWYYSEEQWEYLLGIAINYLEQVPLATPKDFAYYITSNNF